MFNTDLTLKRHINPSIFTSIPTHEAMCLSVEIIIIKPEIKVNPPKTLKGPSKRLITRRTPGEPSHLLTPMVAFFETLVKPLNPIRGLKLFTSKRLLLEIKKEL